MRDLLLLVIAVLAVTENAFAEIHEIPTKCPESADKTVQLAHEHDCTKFYECSNGQKLLSNCPEFASGQKLHFDPELQNCTFPWEANCASRASDCSKDGFIQPHPTNCSLYYKCENGEKVLKSCDEEQLFCSESLQCVDKLQCDIPENVGGCNGDQPTTTTTTTTRRPTTTTTTGWLSFNCIEGNQMPHECNCYEYYVCRNGRYQRMTCPSGEKFDWAERKCMSESIAECRPSGNNGCQGSCSSSSDQLPHRECNKYCTCDSGTTTVRNCPSHTYYDRSIKYCNWPEEIRDLPAHCNPTDCSFGNNYVPHHCYCDRYYKCSGNGKFLQMCKTGEYFDYTEEKCVDSKYAHCYAKI
nr:chondroitin proteoglycan 2-like [Bombus vancouverensis nearcticus]